MAKKILLMYISEHSGHHQASIALEKAILDNDPHAEVLNVDAFRYTNPIMEKVVHKAYMNVIKKRPEIWGRLYDNQEVVKKTESFRNIVNKAGSKKVDRLIRRFNPDAVACTQAFPCGLISAYKKSKNSDIPLVGILTDYAPHSYWISEGVNAYVVPSTDIGDVFIKKGVPAQKIKDLGTPIDPLFTCHPDKKRICEKTGLFPEVPVILVMGGTHGIGPDEKLLRYLDSSSENLQAVMITGVNKKLYREAKKKRRPFKKNIVILGFADNIHELMEISQVIITKPGGLTVAEALAKSLPIIILNPLPGQEDLNTNVLTSKGIAIKAKGPEDAVRIAEDLLRNKEKLTSMKEIVRANARPGAATDIAKLLLKLAN